MKAHTLGELEQQVMDYVWAEKKCSVRNVVNHVQQHRKIAYNTIATILLRLSEKGFVLRKESKEGFFYVPVKTKQTYLKSISQTFLSDLMKSFGDIAIASFAESIEDLPQHKKKYFLDILNQYENNK